MNKRGKITISFVIFVVLVLSLFILQTKIIVSADSNLSINQSNDKNLEFNVKPAQPASFGFGGSAKFSKQPRESNKSLPNIISELQENQVVGVQTNDSKPSIDSQIPTEFNMFNITNVTTIDPKIIENLEYQTEVEVIVKLKSNNSNNYTPMERKVKRDIIHKEIMKNVEEIQSEVIPTLPQSEFKITHKFKLINAFSGYITKEGLNKLKNNPYVKSIHGTEFTQTVLDDSVDIINVDPEVWDLDYTGEGKTICVIDSGIDYTHDNLGDCTQAQFLAGNCAKIPNGYCYCSPQGGCCPNDQTTDSDVMDEYGHGTYVSGIIASTHGTYKGVAPDAKLIVIRTQNESGGGSTSDLAKAVEWCRLNATNLDISIISISLVVGSAVYNSVCSDVYGIVDEINGAHDDGIFVSVASGNGASTSGISRPACASGATSVGASTKADTMWDGTPPGTNRGDILDLLAPGADITSTKLGGGTESGSGTSAAAPHVSGSAALLLDAKSSLTPDQIESALKNTGKTIQSWKRIDVKAALDSVCDKDGDGYLDEACSGGNDCDDNDGSVHPGATEACDGIDNDCDDVIDEGCGEVQECEESGYEWCIEYEDENCDVSIAMNVYENINDIKWGAVNDGWDPYVIDEYTIGWKDREAEKMYYDIDDPNSACTDDEGYCQGYCDGEQIADTGTRVTVTAPGTAHFEEVLGYDEDGDYCCWVWYYAFNPNYGGNNPIYVLKCFDDNDCSSGYYCDKSGSWSSWDCVAKKSNGESCSSDGECTSNNCVTAINSGSKYCAASTKKCSRSGYDPGYDTGDEYGAYICKGDDLGGQQCNSGNACHEYGGKYCNGVNDWVSGDSEGQDANCNVCVVCSSGTGDTPSCSSNVASGTTDAGECISSTGCESSDCACDGSGNCDSDEGQSCSGNSECISNNCRSEIDSAGTYCAASGRECSENSADHQGYNSGDVGNNGNSDWLCRAQDTSTQCTSLTQCDEYNDKYCNGVNTWTSGDSYHLDAACALCTWCGGSAGNNDGDISCINQPSGDAFNDCTESCSGYTHIDGNCDGSGACNTGVACANYLDCADGTSCNSACTNQNNCRSSSYYCNAAGNGCNSDVTDCNIPTDYYSGTVNEACVGGYGRQDWDSTYFCTDDSTGCVTDNTGSCNERSNGYEACDGDNDRVCSNGVWSAQNACPDQTCTGGSTADHYLTDSTCSESSGCSAQVDTECSTCQTCSGTSCTNYADHTQDTTGSNQCTATCKECDGAGNCANQAADDDYFSQCGLVECDGDAGTPYYYGWSSLTCYYREDEADGACDGSGSCKTASDYCPSNPQDGSSGVSCDCDVAEIGCSGTTIGSCDNNLCDQSKFYIRNSTGSAVAWFGDFGNVVLKGTLEQSSAHTATVNDEFRFQDSNGNDVMIIDLTNGNMYIDGTLSENQNTLTPSQDSDDFIVLNETNDVVAYVNESGYMFLKGTLIENGDP